MATTLIRQLLFDSQIAVNFLFFSFRLCELPCSVICSAAVLHQHYSNFTPALQQFYTSITEILHQHYSNFTPTLQQFYTSITEIFTPALQKFYTGITAIYTSITAILHQHYSNFTPTLQQSSYVNVCSRNLLHLHISSLGAQLDFMWNSVGKQCTY
jgi:hypothetical protein